MSGATYSTRRSAIKQLNSAWGNLETSLQHLLRVKQMYEAEHPEHSQAIEVVMMVIAKAQELLEAVKKIW